MKASHAVERGLLVDAVGEEAVRISGLAPPLLFHYTGYSGLQGILESCGIFLSDSRFLNDASEGGHGRAVVLNAVLHRAQDERPEIRRAVERAVAEAGARWNEVSQGARFYVASFCESGNLLSQWRAYSGSNGCALGFDASQLEVNARAQSSGLPFYRGPSLRRVLYQADQQARLADETARLFLFHAGLTHPPMWEVNLPMDGTNLSYLNTFLEPVISLVSPLMKHPTFAEEREWRLVGLHYGHWPDAGGALRFRTTANGLIPYLLCQLGDESPGGRLPIKEICHGPSANADLHQLATAAMLGIHGYKDVKLRASDIPLRGR